MIVLLWLQVNLCPSAGDIVVMPEATCHGIMPWRNAQHGRRLLSLRYKTAGALKAHRAHYPEQPAQEVMARLSQPTLALVSGDTDALHAMCGVGSGRFRPARDPGAVPPPPTQQRRCWRSGVLRTTAVDDPEAWPEMTEFAKLANDAPYGGAERIRSQFLLLFSL